MLKINIKTIPHDDQRYDTVGDYFETADGGIEFRISELSDWKYEALVALHEFVEKILCIDRGITNEDIDAFDMEYERQRVEGDVTEPGDCLRAPYFMQHQIATQMERMLAKYLDVEWSKYDLEVELLGQTEK